MGLNPRQRKFVAEYLIDFNGKQAAIRAGYEASQAHQVAYRWLSNVEVAAAVEEKIAEKLEVAELSVQWVLMQWKKIAEADPSELCWTEIECCRYCYGINNLYQWTEAEYRERVHLAQAHLCGDKCKQPCGYRVPPDSSGGFGFDPNKPPAAKCPRCAGKGKERMRIADTRNLKGSARRLYAGVKQTKDGIEIKMRDQDAALQNISKYFGMILDRREISGPSGGPIQIASLANIDARDLTTDQLIQVILQHGGKPPAQIEAVVE